MTNNRQPALRFYAVTGLASRTMVGRVWHVVDRRVADKSQLLFVPNRRRAWPIWVEQLDSQDATPVRLRSGKVALLFSAEIGHKELRTFLRVPSTLSHQFSATAGFRLGKRKLFGRFTLVSIGAISMLLVVIPMSMAVPRQVDVKPANSSKNRSTVICELRPKVGERLAKSISRGKILTLNQRKHKVLQVSNLGGLHRIRVMRICDRETFDLQAWVYKAGMYISKVD